MSLTYRRNFQIFWSTVVAALLVACGAYGNTGALPGVNPSNPEPPETSSRTFHFARAAQKFTVPQGVTQLTITENEGIRPQSAASLPNKFANLYVVNLGYVNVNGSVTVYAPGSRRVLRTITRGLVNPGTLAFDMTGNLYVANAGKSFSSGSVTVYAPGTA